MEQISAVFKTRESPEVPKRHTVKSLFPPLLCRGRHACLGEFTKSKHMQAMGSSSHTTLGFPDLAYILEMCPCGYTEPLFNGTEHVTTDALTGQLLDSKLL